MCPLFVHTRYHHTGHWLVLVLYCAGADAGAGAGAQYTMMCVSIGVINIARQKITWDMDTPK